MLGQWAASAAESVRAPTGGCSVYVGFMHLLLYYCHRYRYPYRTMCFCRSVSGRRGCGLGNCLKAANEAANESASRKAANEAVNEAAKKKQSANVYLPKHPMLDLKA